MSATVLESILSALHTCQLPLHNKRDPSILDLPPPIEHGWVKIYDDESNIIIHT